MNIKKIFAGLAACAVAAVTMATSAFAADTTVFTGEGKADGSWKQAVTLTTLKNDGGTFDPAVLVSGCVVTVNYTSDSAPEVVLQSWSGGAEWAKVAASSSANGVATFTYADLVAAYGASNFTETLDNFIVGDTGAALTVTKVTVGAAAAAPTETQAPTGTTAAGGSSGSAATGVEDLAVVSSIIVAAGVIAFAAKKKA